MVIGKFSYGGLTVVRNQELITELWYHVDNNEFERTHISHTKHTVGNDSHSFNVKSVQERRGYIQRREKEREQKYKIFIIFT